MEKNGMNLILKETLSELHMVEKENFEDYTEKENWKFEMN